MIQHNLTQIGTVRDLISLVKGLAFQTSDLREAPSIVDDEGPDERLQKIRHSQVP